MKEKHTYTINDLPTDKTDWAKIAKLSDKEIESAAHKDKDASLITKKQLTYFKRAHAFKANDVVRIREKLHMSQTVFAAYFGISKRTLQEWEQGRRRPAGPSCVLLMIIDREPKMAGKVLRQP